MKKVMIMGSAGMLGHMVYNYLFETKRFNLVDCSYPFKSKDTSYLLDVLDKNAVESWVRNEKPDIIVNCIGLLIKDSQRDPSSAVYVNSYLPHQLSKILRETGGRLIHLSTDCVFSGKKGGYAETDFCDAYDMYGRSKALGEVTNDHDLTFRTSLVGPELKPDGEGLFHWFLHQTGNVDGYTNAYWSGVTTLELAKAIEIAIDKEITGLVHFSSGTRVSKYQLLQLIKTIWNRDDITILESYDIKVDKSLLKSDLFKYDFPSYEKMLSDLKDWMNNHSDLYLLYHK
jgi:dTDP-4-dehydrorhamnose reductase